MGITERCDAGIYEPDAYDKFRLSKEDYELQKNWKKNKRTQPSQENDKKKGDNKEKSEEKRGKSKKDIVVELNNIEDRIVRPYSQLFRFGERHYHQRR